jgi:cytochrome oxidase Cu insertion factor (SCO1/SenC/PrrC family)
MVSVDEAHTGAPVAPAAPARHRRRWLVPGVVAAVAVVALAVGLVAGRAGAPGPPPASLGTTFDRAVPASVLSLPLVDQHGHATTLDALHGKVVLIAPSLTSCQEVCPITTGVLLQVRHALAAAGLSQRVTLLEISVDPGRDTPARLAAYARVTGVGWPLLTGSAATLDTLWRYFGVLAQVVPEGTPPGVDWQTGHPYTYDVNHSDGFLLLDARGHERFSTGGMPHTTGALPPALAHMLDTQGRSNLAAPGLGAWSAADAQGALGWLVGRGIPAG